MVNDEELNELETRAQAATQVLWWWARAAVETQEEAAAFVVESLARRDSADLYLVGTGEEGQPDYATICYTGNGPTSQANAQYFYVAQPINMLALITTIRQQRALLRRIAEQSQQGMSLDTETLEVIRAACTEDT